jgi:glycosyltransferase involved in cell wall biosynthesis
MITVFHEIAVGYNFTRPLILIQALIQRLIAYSIALLSYRLVVTIQLYKDVIRFFDKKISIIPVGSNIIPFRINENEKSNIRKSIINDDDYVIISTFGSGIRRTDLLVDSISLLLNVNEGYKIKLLILGGISKDSINLLNSKVKELDIENEVFISGFIDSVDIYKYLYVSDIFVFLEDVDYKGRGGISIKNTSIAAAYAAGLPIIGNRGHMTDDFFKSGVNILLVDQLNPHVIAREIRKLINCPNLRNTLRLNSISTYNSQLSWETIANRYIEFLR